MDQQSNADKTSAGLAALEEEQIPRPVGYKVLVALPEVEKTFGNGLLRPDSLRKDEEMASMLAVVLDMGPDAYKDERKFPSGPFCKPGDTIVMNPYAGTRLRVGGVNMRLINDDTVQAVLRDPTAFERG